MKILIVTLLACSLCLIGRAQELDNPIGLGSLSNTDEPFELLSTKGHDTDFTFTGCVIGISVLTAGTAFVIWLRSWCQQHLGTNNPPSTNMHQVIRSENMADWKLVGSMTWDDKSKTWDYRETNSMTEPFHFYRITNYFGQ